MSKAPQSSKYPTGLITFSRYGSDDDSPFESDFEQHYDGWVLAEDADPPGSQSRIWFPSQREALSAYSDSLREEGFDLELRNEMLKNLHLGCLDRTPEGSTGKWSISLRPTREGIQSEPWLDFQPGE